MRTTLNGKSSVCMSLNVCSCQRISLTHTHPNFPNMTFSGHSFKEKEKNEWRYFCYRNVWRQKEEANDKCIRKFAAWFVTWLIWPTLIPAYVAQSSSEQQAPQFISQFHLEVQIAPIPGIMKSAPNSFRKERSSQDMCASLRFACHLSCGIDEGNKSTIGTDAMQFQCNPIVHKCCCSVVHYIGSGCWKSAINTFWSLVCK